MTWFQVLLLGIVQGATEFLPVSSSGHLVLARYWLGWPDPGIALDTVLHVGTLLALLVYFWRDLLTLAQAAWLSLRHRSLEDPQARLAWALVLGTIPGVLLGVIFEDTIEALFGAPQAAAGFLLVTALLLTFSERFGSQGRALESLTWRDAILIGLAQALAIAPGISRSGATIAVGLLLGFRRNDAARFSFLLAIPIVGGGGAYQILKLLITPSPIVSLSTMGLGLLAAAFTGYAAVTSLLAFVRQRGLYPFAIYCATVGLVTLAVILL